MMMVLKLGGSVVTEKGELMTADEDNIKRLSEEIGESGVRDLVIVHGGGSFGHPLAQRYEINKGYSFRDQILGFSLTHQAMVSLNGYIVDSLLNHGIPAISVSTSSFVRADDARISDIDTSLIREYMDLGMVPVLFGDTVLDKTRGFCILSGDQLVVRIALELSAKRILLGTDVDGIYSSDPKIDPTAKMLNRLSLSEESRTDLSGTLYTDVTGGMAGKLKEVKTAVEAGIEVLILNAAKPGRVRSALQGEAVKGTILER